MLVLWSSMAFSCSDSVKPKLRQFGSAKGAIDQMPDLTEAYSNAAFIPNGAEYPDRWTEYAARFRSVNPGVFNVHYGPGTRETCDFIGKPDAKGLVIFIHGGYWKAFDHSMWTHLGAGSLGRDWAFALLSYDLCPKVRISQITRQVARAVDFLADKFAGPIVLVGHSAGGHLVARLACMDVPLACRGRLARVVPMSAISDLAPLMQTDMNAALRIDAPEALAESPIHHPRPQVPVSVWVGGAERPVFLAQSRQLALQWDAPLHIVPDRHHFDIIELLSDRDSDLVADLVGE
jgi:arylformamidase